MTHVFFWTCRFQVLQGMFVQISRKKMKNWLRRTNFKSNLTPKIEYILKASNYNAKPWFLHLTAQKSNCPRRFWELDHYFLHVFNVPFSSLLRMFCFCSCFFAENVASLTQICKKKTKTQLSDGKKHPINNEARPRERSDRGRFLPSGKKASS